MAACSELAPVNTTLLFDDGISVISTSVDAGGATGGSEEAAGATGGLAGPAGGGWSGGDTGEFELEEGGAGKALSEYVGRSLSSGNARISPSS